MSTIVRIREKLQDTSEHLARLERDFAREPDSFAIAVEIKSLSKMKGQLEAEFLEIATALGREVCDYRIVPNDRLKIAGLANVLALYQLLVSVFVEAVKKRAPKRNSIVSAETAELTALDFAFAYTGSAGFVFSIPDQRDIFDDSDFVDAIKLIQKTSTATTPAEVREHAKVLGPGPIRVLYNWAAAHVKGNLNADIDWKTGKADIRRTTIQTAEFQQLQLAISATSDEEKSEVLLSGTLVGADVTSKTFHFRPDSGADIKGSSGDTIGQNHVVTVPKRYRVSIEQTKTIFYSTEQERTTYRLLGLDPLSE